MKNKKNKQHNLFYKPYIFVSITFFQVEFFKENFKKLQVTTYFLRYF